MNFKVGDTVVCTAPRMDHDKYVGHLWSCGMSVVAGKCPGTGTVHVVREVFGDGIKINGVEILGKDGRSGFFSCKDFQKLEEVETTIAVQDDIVKLLEEAKQLINLY